MLHGAAYRTWSCSFVLALCAAAAQTLVVPSSPKRPCPCCPFAVVGCAWRSRAGGSARKAFSRGASSVRTPVLLVQRQCRRTAVRVQASKQPPWRLQHPGCMWPGGRYCGTHRSGVTHHLHRLARLRGLHAAMQPLGLPSHSTWAPPRRHACIMPCAHRMHACGSPALLRPSAPPALPAEHAAWHACGPWGAASPPARIRTRACTHCAPLQATTAPAARPSSVLHTLSWRASRATCLPSPRPSSSGSRWAAHLALHCTSTA